MKKLLLIVLALSLVVTGVALATVKGSLHDLGSNGLNVITTDQVCVFCHHPHRGTGTGDNVMSDELLWNITKGNTQTEYPVYSGGNTMNAVGAAVSSTVGSESFLCMACHDGGIGKDALVTLPRGTDTNNTKYSLLRTISDLGTTLADDHPINFTYDDAEGELQPSTSGEKVVGAGTTGNEYPLFNGTMQCGTCHDVHAGGIDTGSKCTTDGASCDDTIEFMLGDTDASDICTDCHLDK